MNKRLISSMRIGLALFLSVFGTNLLPVATAHAVGGPPEDNKVFVCKYVGTPHVDERLQTGTNPISVATSSIQQNQWNGNVPGWFSDAHDRSYVLSYDNTTPGPEGDPSVSSCPSPEGPAKVAIPNPTPNDPCGPANATWSLPADTASLDWSLVGGVLSVQTKTGYVFTDDSTSKSFGTAQDSGEVCPPTQVGIPNPTPNDPCGPANASWTLPADTDQLDWSLVGGVLSVQTKTGYVFTDDTTSKNFGLAEDSEEACPPDVVGIPSPTPNDPCGLRNASWTLPDDTDSLDWSLVGGVLSVETKEGYVFTDDTTSKNFGLAEDSNELCPEEGNPDLNFDYDEKCTEEEESDGEASVEIENEGDGVAHNLTVVLRDSEGNLLDIVYDVDVAAEDEVEVTFTDLDLGFYTIEVWDGETMLSTEEVEVDECGGGFPPVDVCLNIDGIQTEVPEGYVKDGDNCARVLGSNDVCPNITGTQTTVPAGMVKDQQGNCVTDICPNLTGIQTSLPAGYTQVNSQCVAPVGGQGQVLGTTLPAALPVTGSTTDIGSGQLLSIIVGFFTYLFLSYRNRKLEA